MPMHSHIQLRRQGREQASWVRVAFALAALVFTDGLFGGRAQAYMVCAGYLGIALVFQRLIRRDRYAADSRAMAMGAIDLFFLTGVVYLLGPASTVLPFAYLLVPILHAASTPTRSQVAMRLAMLGSLAYVAVLALTGAGVLPYAPVQHGQPEEPHLSVLLASGSLVGGSVLITTSLVLRQMRALDRMNERLSELSQLDELTGLFNRRSLTAELRRQLERVGRGKSLGVMMIDLDNFKRINDKLGHETGDLVLVEVASALGNETRSVDMVARYGGDEFVVLLPDLEEQSALAVAQRIVRSVAAITETRWPDLPVTASIGLAMANHDDDLSSVLRRADERAYESKRAGGNRASLAQLPRSVVTEKPTRPIEAQARGRTA